jgi:hypothetical protein
VGLVAAVHLARRLVRTSSELSDAPAVVHALRGSEKQGRLLYIRNALLHLRSTHGAGGKTFAAVARYMLASLDVWLQQALAWA